jgi:hypothetical protein
VFGGVLLTTEKTIDFEWAFKSFISVMGGEAPKTILTGMCRFLMLLSIFF